MTGSAYSPVRAGEVHIFVPTRFVAMLGSELNAEIVLSHHGVEMQTPGQRAADERSLADRVDFKLAKWLYQHRIWTR